MDKDKIDIGVFDPETSRKASYFFYVQFVSPSNSLKARASQPIIKLFLSDPIILQTFFLQLSDFLTEFVLFLYFFKLGL